MLVHVQHCMPRSWRVSSLPILYKPFTKQSILEPLAPHGSGGRVCQILSKCFKSFYKSFTKRIILEHLAPHGSGVRICQTLSRCFKSFTNPLQNGAFWSLWRLEAQEAGSARSFPNASNPLQILYKTEHSGASGASWLRKPDLPSPFQMLQILHKPFTKRSTLEPRALHAPPAREYQLWDITVWGMQRKGKR